MTPINAQPERGRLRLADRDLGAEPRTSLLPVVDESAIPGRRIVRRSVGMMLAVVAIVFAAAAIASMVGTMRVTVPADGTIEPLDVWPVRSRSEGVIASVMVSAGDTVHRGQVVAQLDSLAAADNERKLSFQYQESLVDYDRAIAAAPYEHQQRAAAVAQSTARVQQARAALVEQMTEFGLRPQSMDSVLSSDISGWHVAVDKAVADVRAAEADHQTAVARLGEDALDTNDLKKQRIELARLRGAMDVARAQRGELSVTAPADGVVLTSQVERMAGSFVQPGQQLLEVAGTGRWRAVLYSSERNVHDIQVGDRVTLDIPGLSALDGDRLSGSVTSVANQPIPVSPAPSEQFSAAAVPGAYRVVVALDATRIARIGVDQFRRGYAAHGSITTRSGRIATLGIQYMKRQLDGLH